MKITQSPENVKSMDYANNLGGKLFLYLAIYRGLSIVAANTAKPIHTQGSYFLSLLPSFAVVETIFKILFASLWIPVVVLTAGLVVFPVGLDSPVVQHYCPGAEIYKPGGCQIGWAYLLAIVATSLAFFAPFLAQYTDISLDYQRQRSPKKSPRVTLWSCPNSTNLTNCTICI